MDFIDDKYINLLSPRLQKFKRVKSGLYNFRCPICGDSQRNKSKARGYFYQIKNNTNFKCHNCGVNISLNNFIKKVDINLYKQYTLEKFKEGHTGKNFTTETPTFHFEQPKFKPTINLPKAIENDNARHYLEERKLNPNKFYYAEKFKEWTNSLKPTFESTIHDESRIIIPIFYKNVLVGFQGRALNSSPNKYITVMLFDNSPKIYGLDDIDKTKPVYVTEGPFDSTFLSNSIALCGADGDLEKLDIGNVVWIYDNEPRNKEIHNRMLRVIEKNEQIVIWPLNISQKDINDMVLAGLNVQSIVESNTYSGLSAKLKFTNWKKI